MGRFSDVWYDSTNITRALGSGTFPLKSEALQQTNKILLRI